MTPLVEPFATIGSFQVLLAATGESSPEFSSLRLNGDRKSENPKRVSTSAEYGVPRKRKKKDKQNKTKQTKKKQTNKKKKQNKETEPYQIIKQLRVALY